MVFCGVLYHIDNDDINFYMYLSAWFDWHGAGLLNTSAVTYINSQTSMLSYD